MKSSFPRTVVGALILLLSAGVSCDVNEPSQSEGTIMKKRGAPPPMPAAKRPAPPSVASVSFENVRYEQAYEGDDGEYAQKSGYLAAFEQDSDKPVWTVRVYEVAIDEKLERDVQEVFFASMDIDEAQRAILVENERGRRFRVSIDTREVSPIESE